jgi:hypothetical protein
MTDPQKTVAWIESPYNHNQLSCEATLRYASYCASQIALSEEVNVICPHLTYGNLPKRLFESDEKNDKISDKGKKLATCWYPGKTPVWRDYSALRNKCESIYICADLGVSNGMAKVLEEETRREVIRFEMGGFLIKELTEFKERDAVDQELLNYLNNNLC